MAGWPEPLHHILERASARFGITRMTAVERLDAARQTGFVWTRQPGVVCQAANRQYLAQALANPDVAAVITTEEVSGPTEPPSHQCMICCARPDELFHFLHLHQTIEPAHDALTQHPTARVDPSALLRGEVTVGAGACIGPRVVVAGPAHIGAGVHIEAGAIIGCEGLYAKEIDGIRQHIPHFGAVRVGDGAYIHANAVIARSAIRGEATTIGERAHVGILANVGHDAWIGHDATISSHVVIAGRARIGAHSWIGASAAISNALTVGDHAKVRIGAIVVRDVPSHGDVSGNFAVDHMRTMRAFTRELRREN